MNEELRCYTFTNWMLSPIQQGIQPGHAAMELVNKYMIAEGWQNGFAEQVSEWIANHKTIVCINGGDAWGVKDWRALFEAGYKIGKNDLPYAEFYENEQSLDGSLTSVAVILPARIFDAAAMMRRERYDDTVSVTWDHILNELRVGWTDKDGTVHAHTFNSWERELMNKLNGAQLAR